MRSVSAVRRSAVVSAVLVAVVTGLGGARAEDTSWDGFYAGAQLGGAWSSIDWQYQNANYFNTLGAIVVGNGFDHDPKGVIGGMVGGYNYQTGPWILGIELTASAADMKQERPSPLFPQLDVSTSQVNWLTTIAGRVGYAWDRWLLYAKGGWAGAEVSVSLYDASAGVFGSEDQWANGWTVGGGAEYWLWDCVSLGVGYDYADVSVDGKSITCPACNGPGPGFGTPIVDGDVKVQSVVARLTFHQ